MTTIKNAAPNLKIEWSAKDFKTVETAIAAYFRKTYVSCLHDDATGKLCAAKSFNQYDSIFGFAYTSTSMFAMYSICNTEVYFDYAKQWHFVCFGLADGNSGFVYALLHDEDENEIYFPIN